MKKFMVLLLWLLIAACFGDGLTGLNDFAEERTDDFVIHPTLFPECSPTIISVAAGNVATCKVFNVFGAVIDFDGQSLVSYRPSPTPCTPTGPCLQVTTGGEITALRGAPPDSVRFFIIGAEGSFTSFNMAIGL